MGTEQNKTSRIGPGTILIILVVAYLLTLLGAKDIFGHDRSECSEPPSVSASA